MKNPYAGTSFWRPSEAECAAFRTHLLAEIPVGHVLWPPSDQLQVVARDRNGDRIVVQTGIEATPLAIIQMSWAGRPSIAPFLPETEFFGSEEALIASIRGTTTGRGLRGA